MVVHSYLPDVRLARDVAQYQFTDIATENFRFLRANTLGVMMDPQVVTIEEQVITAPVLACSRLSHAPLMSKSRGWIALITLTQGTWQRLLSIPPQSIDTGIEAIDRPDLIALQGELQGLGEDRYRAVEVLDAYFLGKLRTAEPFGLAEQGREILYRDFSTPIAQIASTLGVTRRTLERAFAHRFGLSPYRYARIIRAYISMGPGDLRAVRWDNVPPEIEYADQSHWIKDIRALYDLTPSAVAAERSYPQLFYPRDQGQPANATWRSVADWNEFYHTMRVGLPAS